MKRQQQDSMGLMIDTMCNGVGGLVLVAILIVLVSIGESPSSAEGQMQRKQLENEVQTLKIRQELLESEIQRMSANHSEFAEGFVETISGNEIQKQLDLIQGKRNRIRELEARLEKLRQEQSQAQLVDPGQYVAAELEVLNRLRSEVEQLEAELANAQDDLAKIEAQYGKLLAKVLEVQKQKSRTLKTPVERSYSRYDFIYFRYGKCYTLAQESQSSPGESFTILDEDDYSIMFEPRRDSGVQIDSNELREFLSFVKRSGGTCSLGFYPDSFHLYLPMKKLVDEHGLSLGIDFYTNSTPPGFTSRGGVEIMGQE